MQRLNQIILIGSFIPLCWLGMMVVHELGHVLAAWVTGGTVVKVVLHPLAISRTDVMPNPEPLIVVWAGAVLGVVSPVLLWGVLVIGRLGGAYLPRFYAGFCLIANGAYLGVGSFAGIGDAGDMIHHGTPRWCLWAFGVITLPTGFWLWHGLGPKFGLGSEAPGRVDKSAAYVSVALLAVLVTLELIFSTRS